MNSRATDFHTSVKKESRGFNPRKCLMLQKAFTLSSKLKLSCNAVLLDSALGSLSSNCG